MTRCSGRIRGDRRSGPSRATTTVAATRRAARFGIDTPGGPGQSETRVREGRRHAGRRAGTIARVQAREPRILRSPTLTVALLAIVSGGCAGPEPPPAASSNEMFPVASPFLEGEPELDDRWSSVVLDPAQNAEVRRILADAADGVEGLEPLGPAPNGIRFEDVPRAMLNTAPKVEMAILRSEHLDPEIVVDFDDAAGRAAIATIRFGTRGPLASIVHRIPGSDAAPERARIQAAIERLLRAWPIDATPGLVVEDVVRVLADGGAIVSDRTIRPERWRYTLLMLDEQEATIEIRRAPPPTMVEWTATAGIFPRPEIARKLGETFMDCLRAWGREARWNGGVRSAVDEMSSEGSTRTRAGGPRSSARGATSATPGLEVPIDPSDRS